MSIDRFDCTNGRAQHCYGCYQMTKEAEGDYVLHYDHIAALAAEQARAERAEAVLAKHAPAIEFASAMLATARPLVLNALRIEEAALALRPSGDGVG